MIRFDVAAGIRTVVQLPRLRWNGEIPENSQKRERHDENQFTQNFFEFTRLEVTARYWCATCYAQHEFAHMRSSLSQLVNMYATQKRVHIWTQICTLHTECYYWRGNMHLPRKLGICKHERYNAVCYKSIKRLWMDWCTLLCTQKLQATREI